MPPPADTARSQHHRLPGAIRRPGVWLSSRFTRRYRDGLALLGAHGLPVSHAAPANGVGVGPRRRPSSCDGGGRSQGTRGTGRQSFGPAMGRATTWGARGLPKFPAGPPASPVAERQRGSARECPRGRAAPESCSPSPLRHAHRPPRQRERRWPGGKSTGHAPRLRAASGPMAPPCRPRRHLLSASASRAGLRKRCAHWADMPGTKRAASRVGRAARGPRRPQARLRLNNLTKPLKGL